jgi:hypothetical protein
VPGNERKVLGEYDLGPMTQPFNNIKESGVWHKVFIVVTMTNLKKEPKDVKCGGYCTICPIAHTAKLVARALRGRIARNT